MPRGEFPSDRLNFEFDPRDPAHFDARNPRNFYLELDAINQRWRDLALEHRDAPNGRERKRIASEMKNQEDWYRTLFEMLEKIVESYRPKAKR